MMTKSPSTIMARMKVMIALPAVLLALFYFSAISLTSLQAQDKAVQQSQRVSGEKPVQTTQTQVSKDSTFIKPDVLPQFPGGQDVMFKFLAQNIQYPEKAKQDRITGTVFITFIVEKDGSVTNIKILRGIGGGCDEEAFRVIKMMPRWEPGKSKDKPVRTAFNLPVKFVLEKDKK